MNKCLEGMVGWGLICCSLVGIAKANTVDFSFKNLINSEVIESSAEKHFAGRFSFSDRVADKGDELGIFYNGNEERGWVGYSNAIDSDSGWCRLVVYGDDWKTGEIEEGMPYGMSFETIAYNFEDNKLYNVDVKGGKNNFRGLGWVDYLHLQAQEPVDFSARSNDFSAEYFGNYIPEPHVLSLLGLGSLALRKRKRR